MKQVKQMKQELKQDAFEKQIKDEIKNVELSDCLVEIDPTKDYRIPLEHYKVNEHGDLLTWYWGKWHVLIERERLAEDDWISHMRAKTKDFGEFVSAYLKACELAGIKELKIRVYEFACSHRYADE